MTATYEKIATTTLSSAQATVDFTSISGSYTDLILIMQVTTSSGGNYSRIRFNSDTGSNYSFTRVSGTGSSATSSRGSNQTYIEIDNESFVNTTIANRILQIQNYSNTTTFKTVLGRNNNSSNGTGATAGLWRSTSAITSISVFLEASGTFNSGSTFTLYGIKAE
jgi:hypothetical protein